MQQLEGYDELFNALSSWLKDTEAGLRNEAGLKPDLDHKKRQLEAFKVPPRVDQSSPVYCMMSYH